MVKRELIASAYLSHEAHFYKCQIIAVFPSGNIISIWEERSAKVCCDPEKNLSACADRDHTSELLCVQLNFPVILYPEGAFL